MALAIMWSLTAITLVFVVLRFYTRAIVLRQVGWDDHIFVLSGVSPCLSLRQSLPRQLTRLPADFTSLLHDIHQRVGDLWLRASHHQPVTRRCSSGSKMGDGGTNIRRDRNGNGQGLVGLVPPPPRPCDLA